MFCYHHTGQDASGSDDRKYSWTDRYFHADMSYWGRYDETWIDVSADRAKQHPLQVKYTLLDVMVVTIDITALQANERSRVSTQTRH